MAYKYVFFDVDGTLLDSFTVVMPAIRRAAAEALGHPVDDSRDRELYSLTLEENLRIYGITENLPAVAARSNELIRQAAAETRFFPHILEVLEALREAGIPLGIFTAREESEMSLEPAFEETLPLFSAILNKEYCDEPKPSPKSMLLFMESAGLAPEEVLFIGDSVIDSQAAYGAGVDFARAGWYPYATADRFHYDPKDPRELLEIVLR